MLNTLLKKTALPFGVVAASFTSIYVIGYIIDDAYKYNLKLIRRDYEEQINNLKLENKELHEKLRPFIVTNFTKV